MPRALAVDSVRALGLDDFQHGPSGARQVTALLQAEILRVLAAFVRIIARDLTQGAGSLALGDFYHHYVTTFAVTA